MGEEGGEVDGGRAYIIIIHFCIKWRMWQEHIIIVLNCTYKGLGGEV